MSTDEYRRKIAALISDADITKLLDALELSAEERVFATEMGPALFRHVVGAFGERVNETAKLRPVAISAALVYAMITAETFAKERGHH